jgi:hypothetical protein
VIDTTNKQIISWGLSYLTVECDTARGAGQGVGGIYFEVSGLQVEASSAVAAVRNHNNKNAPSGHTRDFDLRSETDLERLLQHYWPGIIGQQLVELFDNRIDRTTVANWRAGRRRMPQWAIVRLEQQIRDFERYGHELISKLAPGPTRRANAVYLKRWQATRRLAKAGQQERKQKNAPA